MLQYHTVMKETPYDFPDFWTPNSPDLKTVDYRLWSIESIRQKCRM